MFERPATSLGFHRIGQRLIRVLGEPAFFTFIPETRYFPFREQRQAISFIERCDRILNHLLYAREKPLPLLRAVNVSTCLYPPRDHIARRLRVERN